MIHDDNLRLTYLNLIILMLLKIPINFSLSKATRVWFDLGFL